ncbi:hypothetical protein AUJ14_01325 [Candidatus Micrarchaeota archaeon CG1_02_55_22]|nr:MAG: hypothetical protein AUJ14_01325 [Candidatus Micrarchaeota archaeon CG1_02_55_22]
MSFLGKLAAVIGIVAVAVFALAAFAPSASAYSSLSSVCSSNGYYVGGSDVCNFVRDPTSIQGCRSFSYNCASYPSKFKNACVGYDYYDYTNSYDYISNTYWNPSTKKCEYYSGYCQANIEYNSPKCGYQAPSTPTYNPPTTPSSSPLDVSISFSGQALPGGFTYGSSSYGAGAIQSPGAVGGDYWGNSYSNTEYADTITNSFNSYSYDYSDSFNSYTDSFNTYNYGSSGSYYSPSYYSPSYYTPSYNYGYNSGYNYGYNYGSYSPYSYNYAAYRYSGATTSPSFYAYYYRS